MIEGYEFGQITVEGRVYTRDVIIYPDRVDDTWWRREGHRLCLEDVEEALAEEPEVLVIGTGAVGRMEVDPDLRAHLESAQVRVVVARTAEACEQYNQLAIANRVIAALHLTC